MDFFSYQQSISVAAALTNINAKAETFTLLADTQNEATSPIDSPTTEHLQAENELNEIDDYPKVIDVNGTIEEVEQILASNPDLPRLSRNEILSILENITTQDRNQSEFKIESENENVKTESIESERNTTENNPIQPENFKTQAEYMRAMRALMLVLPFNAKNLTYSEIKELYTKAPITRLVGERPGEVVQTTTSTTTTTRKPPITVVTSQETTTTSKSNPLEEIKQYTNHHEVFHQPYDVQPILSSSNYGFDQVTTSIGTTEHITTTKRYKHRPNYPHRRRRPTTSPTTTQLTTNTPEIINKVSTIKPQTQTPENYHDHFLQYQAEEYDTHKEIPPAQIYQTTKVPLVDKYVTPVEPERATNYKTTEQHYQPSSPSPITTVYAQYTKVNENHAPPNNNEFIKQNQDYISQSIENQSQNQVFHSNKKRTKPPRSTTVPEPTSTTEMAGIAFDLPHEMKDLLVKFDVDDHLPKVEAPLQMKPETTNIFVTPTTESSKILAGSNPDFTKYSSQYSASELIYDRVTTEKAIMRDEVKELLASIGLFPAKGSETTSSTTTTTTTTTETPNIEAAAESFSPEMKDLLISFGLLPSANDIQHFPGQDGQQESIPAQQTYDNQAASPVIDPSSYLNFKPLPVNAEENSKEEDDWNSDMKQFLASFGLMPSASGRSAFGGDNLSDKDNAHGKRSQKALNINDESLTNSTESSIDLETAATTQIKNEKVPLINMDMLNDDMKEVLENLGFFPSQESFDSEIKRKTDNAEGHIFNPSAHLASLNPTEEEAERLSKLLETIKKLMKENGTISQDEIEALNASISFILPPVPVGNYSEAAQSTEAYTNIPLLFSPKKTLNKSVPLDKVKDAPDPLSFEELLSMMEDHKNEVKRQQPNETSTTISTTTEEEEEEATKDPGPSLTDLAASFGGGETASADANVEEALPPKKPNGLYFLLDWNTFLNVDGDTRKINLQFSPKLGDSRAFQSVSVP
ncbi:hypothetical protein C0J52_15457 [Blattella germanica]|nr:hypothetical protein C0J52_15457 [Blattella germanica]